MNGKVVQIRVEPGRYRDLENARAEHILEPIGVNRENPWTKRIVILLIVVSIYQVVSNRTARYPDFHSAAQKIFCV